MTKLLSIIAAIVVVFGAVSNAQAFGAGNLIGVAWTDGADGAQMFANFGALEGTSTATSISDHIDQLIGSTATFENWQTVLGTTNPADVNFAVFGTNAGGSPFSFISSTVAGLETGDISWGSPDQQAAGASNNINTVGVPSGPNFVVAPNSSETTDFESVLGNDMNGAFDFGGFINQPVGATTFADAEELFIYQGSGNTIPSLPFIPAYLQGFVGGTVIDDGLFVTLSFDGDNAVAQLNVVPVPAAVWLLGAGLAGLVGLRRRA